MGQPSRYVGWGCGFFDFDNDGWQDLLLVNGHAFPEVDKLNIDVRYRERAILYRNVNGKFADVSKASGAGINQEHASRGAAFGDYDNDGSVDVLVNNQNETPSLLRQAATPAADSLSSSRRDREGVRAIVGISCGERRPLAALQSCKAASGKRSLPG